MSRKQVRISPTATGPVESLVPSDRETWVARATSAAMGEPSSPTGDEVTEPPRTDLLARYGAMLSQCRTPQDLIALQLWAMRAQCELGLAQASRVALSFGAALQSAAAQVAPRP
jgi:hypothetical protein